MAKAQVEDLGLWGGSPDGIRTRATALRAHEMGCQTPLLKS
jgi:hypothetical protein